jgi:uncharacterized protein (TIGR03437 family)
MLKNALASCVICLFLCASGLRAQAQEDVFAVPGANSIGTSVLAFSANPLDNITGFSTGAGTFLILAKPDGSKFYAIANSGSATVTEIPNTFASSQTIGNLGTQATAAAMSEDGKRLAVAAGLLHIFETTGDTDILPNGISIGSGITVFDVAASLDGSTFYVLGSTNTSANSVQSVLAAVNASTGQISASLPITGPTEAVSVGPNGLVYISAPNQILELNPTTLATTTANAIVVNGKPGKLVFTIDGLYALAINETISTGSLVLQIGLSSHAVLNTLLSSGFNAPLTQLEALNSSTILAYSSQNQSLYQIGISSNGGLSINAFALPGIQTSTVQGFALSNEVPAGTRSDPESLFVAVNGTIYREDLPTSTVTGQFPLSITTGGLSFAGAATTGTLVTTLLQYGSNQTLALGGTSLPLVVRVLDNNGNALSGITVTWAASSSSASLSPVRSVTGTDGYALTYLTAPPVAGPLTVTATAGTQTASFPMVVSSGGGGGPTTGGISIIAGQGQIVFENNNTGIAGFGSPLIVQVNDVNGKPVPGATVTFAVTTGPGSVTALGSQPGTVANSIVVVTGANGQATADYLSSTIGNNGQAYASTTITASAQGAGSVNFYMTTVPNGSAAQIIMETPSPGATLTGPAGSTITGGLVIQVVSSAGVAIPNVGVVIGGGSGGNAPNASCNNPTGNGLLTNANGLATCDIVLTGVVGTGTFYGNVGYFQNTPNFNIRITAGAAGVVRIIQGNNQSGAPGQKLPTALVVQVTDTFGNILTGVPVTWSVVTAGTVTLSSIISTSDPNGEASALATLGGVAGNAQVKVTAGTGATAVSATFTLSVNVPAAGISKVSGDGQSTLVSTGFPAPLVVSVADANGNPVQGATITFQVTSGTATLGTPSVTTGANGQASTTVTAGATAGTIQISATTAGLSLTPPFTLTANPPGPNNVMFANAASFPPPSPTGPVAPGEIVVISGSGIAPGVNGLVTAYNIIGQPQPSLAGVSITFNGVAAPIYYVSTTAGQPDQVVVLVPFETQTGTASVVINAAGGGSATVNNVQVQQFAPGVFQTTIGGQQIAVAVRSDGSYVSPSNPAQPGEVIQIFVTGLGQVSPATATGNAGVPGQTVVGSVVVGLNNGGVPLISAVYAPGMTGVYILTLQVPIDTQAGPAQPLGVVAFDAAGNPYFASGTVLPIQ